MEVMLKTISRRKILKFMGLASLPIFVNPFEARLIAQEKNSRVVQVRDPEASSYGFAENELYAGKVNQVIVNSLVAQGLMILTDTYNTADAWKVLIPSYRKNQKIAIKVNFNNIFDHWGGFTEQPVKMNALPETVNALVKSLKEFGVKEQDIWVYDSVRSISSYFEKSMLYPGVKLWDNSGEEGRNLAHHDTSAEIKFQDPNIRKSRVCNVLANADYLINMPLLKTHTAAGVTLSFKNHFGTVSDCFELHDWVWPSGIRFSADYNPLVDIGLNPHIKNKTVLVLGDGIFGNYHTHMGPPIPWPKRFNNGSPNSLLFSRDPVAADSVMRDILRLEKGGDMKAGASYLPLAEAAGLGVFEEGTPFRLNGYRKFDFISNDLYETGMNLALINAAVRGNQLSPGENAVFNVQVKNNSTNKSLPIKVAFYLSKNKKLNRKDYFLGYFDMTNLAPASLRNKRWKQRLDSSLKSGQYYLLSRLITAAGPGEILVSSKKYSVS